MKAWVKATGAKVPRKENATTYIGDEPVEVEFNTYYYRRILDGELVEVKAPKASGEKKGA